MLFSYPENAQFGQSFGMKQKDLLEDVFSYCPKHSSVIHEVSLPCVLDRMYEIIVVCILLCQVIVLDAFRCCPPF